MSLRYWTKSDIAELTRLAKKAKSTGRVLDVVKVGNHFNRTPLAVFHKLTSLGLQHDPNRTIKVWHEYNIQREHSNVPATSKETVSRVLPDPGDGGVCENWQYHA